MIRTERATPAYGGFLPPVAMMSRSYEIVSSENLLLLSANKNVAPPKNDESCGGEHHHQLWYITQYANKEPQNVSTADCIGIVILYFSRD
jgi:hypothetical protein